MISGITTADLGTPNYEQALIQHADYVDALEECGLDITHLNADENYPDSTFVEDVALLTKQCAIITNPKVTSRAGEIELIKQTVKNFYAELSFIRSPGYLEAGDVMMVDKHFFIGLSNRTNKNGAHQLIKILEKYGLTGSVVALTKVLHLKTGLGYLQNNNLLACGEFLIKPDFRPYNILKVDSDEAYAANSVWINNQVLTPKGFPKTKKMIEKSGYKTREVDVSEFQKIDGGLSCLSLRF